MDDDKASDMDIPIPDDPCSNNEICDFLFSRRTSKIGGVRVKWWVCEKSSFYYILMDILTNGHHYEDIYSEILARHGAYKMCIQVLGENECRVHDACLITIDTIHEMEILHEVLNRFTGDQYDTFFKLFFGRSARESRQIFTGAYLSGTMYSSTFLEHRNNECPFAHSVRRTKILFFYDDKFGRGHKYRVDDENHDILYITNRDGREYRVAADDSINVIYPYIMEILGESALRTIVSTETCNAKSYIAYIIAATKNVDSLDHFTNKKYYNFGQSAVKYLEKIGVLRNKFKPFWNSQTIDTGRIPVFHTVKYAKTSEMKMKEARKGVKTANPKLSRQRPKESTDSLTINTNAIDISINVGSQVYKNGETTIQKTSNAGIPSIFKSITYINMQKINCDSVQRTMVTNVRTENARKLPIGCRSFLDQHCMGKINNSGKTAIFCDGVRISYYDKYSFETTMVDYLKNNINIYTDTVPNRSVCAQIVIQKIITKYSLVNNLLTYQNAMSTMVHIKQHVNKFCTVLFYQSTTNPHLIQFVSIHCMEGVPMQTYAHLAPNVLFCRRELEFLYTLRENRTLDNMLDTDTLDILISRDYNTGFACLSKQSMCTISHSNYVPPARKFNATTGKKTSIADISYLPHVSKINNINTLLMDYEKAQSDHVPLGCSVISDGYPTTIGHQYIEKGDGFLSVPVNIGQRLDYLALPTIFADCLGDNAEDAIKIAGDINFHLTFVKCWGLRFRCDDPSVKLYDPNKGGVNSLIISSNDRIDDTDRPLTVTILLATVKRLKTIDGRDVDIEFNRTGYSVGAIDNAATMASMGDNNEDRRQVLFQDFKKVNVFKNDNDEYVIYVQTSDKIIIDNVVKYKERNNNKWPAALDIFDEYVIRLTRYSNIRENFEKNWYAQTPDFSCTATNYYIHLQTVVKDISFVKALKVYDLSGSKGITSLVEPDTRMDRILSWLYKNDLYSKAVVIMNNVSMLTRALKGCTIAMERNFPRVITTEHGEKILYGLVPYIINGHKKDSQFSRSKFDCQSQISMLMNGLNSAVSSKCADNMWITDSRILSTPCRQILDNLLTCNKFFEFNDDIDRYTNSADLHACSELYKKLKQKIKIQKKNKKK